MSSALKLGIIIFKTPLSPPFLPVMYCKPLRRTNTILKTYNSGQVFPWPSVFIPRRSYALTRLFTMEHQLSASPSQSTWHSNEEANSNKTNGLITVLQNYEHSSVSGGSWALNTHNMWGCKGQGRDTLMIFRCISFSNYSDSITATNNILCSFMSQSFTSIK